MQALPASNSCFVCGKLNPSGLRLRFHTDGERAYTRLRFGAEHTGFRQVVHGGLISTVLDEVMVWACGLKTGRFAYCVELNVRFKRPVRPDVEVIAEGELTLNRRNRIYDTAGVLKAADGEVLATATGSYFPIKESEMEELLADLEWDPRRLSKGS